MVISRSFREVLAFFVACGSTSLVILSSFKILFSPELDVPNNVKCNVFTKKDYTAKFVLV